MAPIIWNAYRYLNIIDRDSHNASCVGSNIRGQRCRWQIPNENIPQIQNILDNFETEAPVKAKSTLRRLARLSLCEENHQYQAPDIIEGWKVAIREATHDYKRITTLRQTVRDLRHKLNAEESKTERLENRIEIERSFNDDAEKAKISLQTKLTQTEIAVKDLKSKLQNLSTSYDQLMERMTTDTSEWAVKRGSLEIIQQEQRQRMGFLTTKLKETEGSKMGLLKQIVDLTKNLQTEAQNTKAISEEKDQLQSQLSSELENIANLRQSLHTATDDLSAALAQLSSVQDKHLISENKTSKLEGELRKTAADFEEERQNLITQHMASLACIDELKQMMRGRRFPLFDSAIGWMKSIYEWFGTRNRWRKPVTQLSENIIVSR